MQFQAFFDPFGAERAARDQESQISARNTRTSLDLFTMQQQMDAMRNRQAYLQEVQKSGTAQQPQAQGQQGQQQQPSSASDMILAQIGEMDKRIEMAGRYNQLDEQDKLLKLREQAMGRYSLALDRETKAKENVDKQRKENVSAVSRFASGVNAILSDEKMSPQDQRAALEELESAAREENPQAYKVLAAGQPSINWSDPRTYNRMKALEQQAITPEKRVELSLAKQRADEQKARDETYARRVDALIAASRERGEKDDSGGKLPVGKRWVDPKDHSQGMEDIPDRSKTPANVPKDVHGQPYLDALPEDDRELIKGIAEGRIDPKTLSTRGGHREEVLKKVAQYRPDWNQAKFSVYQAVQKDFTSGVAAKNVTAINTAIAHMGTLKEMADAMHNHDTQRVNQLVNRVKTEFGNPNVNNLDVAASAVGNELMRVFRQVGASEAEIKDWTEKFSKVSSPAQFEGAIRTASELLRGRIEAVDDQWKRGMDSKEGYPNLLSEKSKRVMTKLGAKVSSEPGKRSSGGAMSLEDYIKSKEGQ